MPSPLKRPSLGRLLASLLPLARAGTLPVQTGFPTSLADLVVKNHVRLRKPPRRPNAVAPSSPAPPFATEPPPQAARPELSPVQQDAVRPAKGAAFRLGPELLALALLVIWSKEMVAAFTVASLSLLWIESRRRPAGAKELLDLCGRGPISPIREVVEPETETPTSSCSCSDKGSELADDPTNPKRSLRKLISKKLHKKPKAKDSCDAVQVQLTEQTPSSSVDGPAGGRFPLAAFIPVILVGLVAGKLLATAVTVLCVAFSSAIERLPAH